jgi:hypothetical protein
VYAAGSTPELTLERALPIRICVVARQITGPAPESQHDRPVANNFDVGVRDWLRRQANRQREFGLVRAAVESETVIRELGLS